MTVKNFSNSVVVGSIITDIEEMNRLKCCDKAEQISACGRPLIVCSFGVCRSFGERAKFKCISDGYRIIWLCDKAEFSEYRKEL